MYRERLSCIGRGRAVLMLVESAILSAIMKCWPVNKMRITDHGIREGLIMAMTEEDRQSQILVSKRPAA